MDFMHYLREISASHQCETSGSLQTWNCSGKLWCLESECLSNYTRWDAAGVVKKSLPSPWSIGSNLIILPLFCLSGPLHLPRRVRRASRSFWGHLLPPAEPGHRSWGRPSLEERCAVQRPITPRPAPRPGRRHQWVQNHYAQSTIPQLPRHKGGTATDWIRCGDCH